MDLPTAQRVLAKLDEKVGALDAPEENEQRFEVKRALNEGEPMAQAVLLQRLYRSPAPLSPLHEHLIVLLEESLHAELARVLGMKTSALRTRLHRGQPAFGRAVPREPALPSHMPETVLGWERLRTFHVSGGAMAIGEWPVSDRDQSNLVVPCENGTWVVLEREDSQGLREHLTIHASALSEIGRLLRRSERVGEVGIDAARIYIVDEAIREDWSELRALEREDEGRGYICDMEDDGAFEVFGARRRRRRAFVLFHVPVARRGAGGEASLTSRYAVR
jgi:hypothetical protein